MSRASNSGRKRRAAAAAAEIEADAEEVAAPAARGSQQIGHPLWDADDPDIAKFDEKLRMYTAEASIAGANAKLHLSSTEADTLLREVMRFMIIRNEVKPGVPVPRGELTKLFPAQRRAAAAMVIKWAQASFVQDLGLEMRELKVASAKAPAGSDEGSKHYVLRSLEPAVARAAVMDPADAPSQAFVLTVLALIVMNGDRLGEEDLWRLLKDVGVTRGEKARDAHPTLGKPEDQIKLMQAKRYLKASKGRGAEAGTVYEWSANAEDEVGRAAVDEFIREMIENEPGDP